MGTETDPGFGLGGTVGWAIGGAVGGAIGAAAFGLLMWAFDPGVLEAAVPGIYGFDSSTALGMSLHVLHGAALGVVFGFLVTRPAVLGIVRTDVETEAVSETGLALRIVAAGFVFGLAVWAILPLLVLPVWVDAIGTAAAGDFPAIAVESLLGHTLFGLVLGLVFAVLADVSNRPINLRFVE
ncbi:hypothetical protein [Halovivax sp.]|uniref:hypothetical protein n=1 Tax=Halovivax sp. TaxID=1935978 RepID=UPI0025BF2E87|nr:hypothetical protein [Halovivax sp.]